MASGACGEAIGRGRGRRGADGAVGRGGLRREGEVGTGREDDGVPGCLVLGDSQQPRRPLTLLSFRGDRQRLRGGFVLGR